MEPEREQKKCEKCGATVMIATLRTGKKIPVNLPAEVRIVEVPQGSSLFGIVYTYTAHEPVCSKTKELAEKRRAAMGSSR